MGFGFGRERERREREAREKTGYDPFALHAAPYTGLYSWGRSSGLTREAEARERRGITQLWGDARHDILGHAEVEQLLKLPKLDREVDELVVGEGDLLEILELADPCRDFLEAPSRNYEGEENKTL